MHKISIIEWNIYISSEERNKGFQFDDEFKLEIFKVIFEKADGHQTDGIDYRLFWEDLQPDENEDAQADQQESSTSKITALPLIGADRTEFIETANAVFDYVLKQIEPQHPDLVRKLWNAEKYIDEELLRAEMLPIDRDYALSLIDAFLIHHVIGLAVETDDPEVM